ncbi:MAG: hypothetical protein HQK81_00575 [Desulfovibrionaceae bacterium]|nr:hypothetical protein [Desulfovibrionaceae bacterium]MBF0512541.1 hypothetical protein [Desulfovibrionaceae bacterium]
MIDFAVSLAIVSELALCIVSIGLRVRSLGRSTPHAFAYASILTMSAWSVAAQTVLIAGRPGLYYFVDAGIVVFCLATLRQYRTQLNAAAGDIRLFLAGRWDFPLFFLLIAICYLAVQTLLAPPTNIDGFDYHLPRVLLMIREKTLFLGHYNAIRQRVFPVGSDVLFFPFLRFNSDFSLGIYSFISYLVIAIGAYSIAFELSNSKKSSIITSLVIASSTKIVLQSLSVKNDIILGAIAITLLMAVLNLTRDKTIEKRKSSFDLFYIFAAVTFAMSVKYYFAAFLAVFFAVFFVANKDLRLAGLIARLRRSPNAPNAPLALLAFTSLGLTLVWAWANFRQFGSPFGPESFVQFHKNTDGVAGASLNALRYAAELIDLPGEKITEGLVSLVNQIAGPGSRTGTLFDFKINADLRLLRPDEDFCAFGPLTAFITMAATLFATFRARGFVRRAAFIPPAIFAVFCFTLPWMPWNLRFFTLIFASAAPAVGFFICSLSRYRVILFAIGLCACANIVFTLTFNNFYGLFPPFSLIQDSESTSQFPYWLDLSLHRPRFYDSRTGGALKTFVRDMRGCKKILFMGDENFHLFPFLLAAKGLDCQVEGLELPGQPPETNDLPPEGAQANSRASQYDLIVASGDPKSLSMLPAYYRNDFDAPITLRSRILADSVVGAIYPLRADPGSPGIGLVNIESSPRPHRNCWMFGPRAAVKFYLPRPTRLCLSFRIVNTLPLQSLNVFVNDTPLRSIADIPQMGQVKDEIGIDFPAGWNEIEFVFGDWNNKSIAYRPNDPLTYAAVLEDIRLESALRLDNPNEHGRP